MKKSLVAFAIFGAFASAASAQSSVVLYGIVDASVTHASNQTATGGKKMALENGQLSSSRWGLKGTEDLGNGLKANFRLESSLGADSGTAGSGSTLFDRNATVGLSSKEIGTVDFGRQNNLAYDGLNAFDPMNGAFYSTANPNATFGFLAGSLYNTHGTNNGATSTQRQNNSVKYTTNDFAGFTASAMYGFGEKAGDASASNYSGAVLNYANGDISAAFSYSQLKDAANLTTLRAYTGAAKFKVNALTFKLTYAENELNTTGRTMAVLGAGVDYALSADTTLTGAYYSTRRSGDIKGKADQFAVIAKYALSKRTAAYAGFNYVRAGSSLAKDTDAAIFVAAGNKTATRTTVGINHSF